MPGRTYAEEYDEFAARCIVHDAWEMWHTCGGMGGEPLGYCEAWPGDYVEETRDETPFHRFREVTCKFVHPNRPDIDEEDE